MIRRFFISFGSGNKFMSNFINGNKNKNVLFPTRNIKAYILFTELVSARSQPEKPQQFLKYETLQIAGLSKDFCFPFLFF